MIRVDRKCRYLCPEDNCPGEVVVYKKACIGVDPHIVWVCPKCWWRGRNPIVKDRWA